MEGKTFYFSTTSRHIQDVCNLYKDYLWRKRVLSIKEPKFVNRNYKRRFLNKQSFIENSLKLKVKIYWVFKSFKFSSPLSGQLLHFAKFNIWIAIIRIFFILSESLQWKSEYLKASTEGHENARMVTTVLQLFKCPISMMIIDNRYLYFHIRLGFT